MELKRLIFVLWQEVLRDRVAWSAQSPPDRALTDRVRHLGGRDALPLPTSSVILKKGDRGVGGKEGAPLSLTTTTLVDKMARESCWGGGREGGNALSDVHTEAACLHLRQLSASSRTSKSSSSARKSAIFEGRGVKSQSRPQGRERTLHYHFLPCLIVLRTDTGLSLACPAILVLLC